MKNQKRNQVVQQLADDTLDIVTGGTKTVIVIDDTKIATGGLILEIDGEMVALENDGDTGFRGTIHGKEYRFTYAEIAEMLREMLNN